MASTMLFKHGPLRRRTLSTDDLKMNACPNDAANALTPSLSSLASRTKSARPASAQRARSVGQRTTTYTTERRTSRSRAPFATAQLLADWQQKSRSQQETGTLSLVHVTRTTLLERRSTTMRDIFRPLPLHGSSTLEPQQAMAVDNLGETNTTAVDLSQPPTETVYLQQARSAKDRLAAELAELRRRERALSQRPHAPIIASASMLSAFYDNEQPTHLISPRNRGQLTAPQSTMTNSRRDTHAQSNCEVSVPKSRDRVSWKVDVDVVKGIRRVVRTGDELRVSFINGTACALFAAHLEMLKESLFV
ncbi:hypothetical protein J8273_4909 [Carpediemonas membranifera]|uniref:Uncharacterized protein n=1 Tax=Carpediemonas membranifera TaxID=201153 RepID=A0A8J6E9P0_9EUKA|nr:hypothetical protein J8273_4909 [Carpediemonas membranifera]|eukprot:KAG9393610.1 hypothetical protein J8273_4909 [Carpediemonas membranifera]